MAKKHHDHEHEGEHEHDREHGRGPRHEHKESGDDPKRHAAIIARRWIGSAKPTPELYARALEQWRALPGSIVTPASDLADTSQPVKPSGPAENEK